MRLRENMLPVSEQLALRNQRPRQQWNGGLWGMCLKNGWTYVHMYLWADLGSSCKPSYSRRMGWVFQGNVPYVKLKLQHLHLPSVFLHHAGGPSCNFILPCLKFATPHVFPSYTTAVVERWNVPRVPQRREMPTTDICNDEQRLLQRVILTLCCWDFWHCLYAAWGEKNDCGNSIDYQKRTSNSQKQ